MIKGIKEIVESGDIRRLKYIFVDALDVDPTFVRYEESYNYVKSIPGLLEKHIELTPFSMNTNDWSEEYWNKLKRDLMDNFSDIRIAHMREVAQVFYAEKVQRILTERTRNNSADNNESFNDVIEPNQIRENVIVNNYATAMPTRAEQELMIQQKKLEIAEENRLVEEQKRAQDERIEKAQKEHEQTSGGLSKKALGVAIAAVVGMAILYQILD